MELGTVGNGGLAPAVLTIGRVRIAPEILADWQAFLATEASA